MHNRPAHMSRAPDPQGLRSRGQRLRQPACGADQRRGVRRAVTPSLLQLCNGQRHGHVPFDAADEDIGCINGLGEVLRHQRHMSTTTLPQLRPKRIAPQAWLWRLRGLILQSTAANTAALSSGPKQHCCADFPRRRAFYVGNHNTGHCAMGGDGRIDVVKGAQKTDAAQNFRALLLEKGATANTKPELEIFADDVQCAHGAAIGQMDEMARYYMAARGIAPDVARKLLVQAFIGDAFVEMRNQDEAERMIALALDELEGNL